MSAHATTSRITCEDNKVVPLTARQQAIITPLRRSFKNPDEVQETLAYWDQRLPSNATFHQIGERIADALRREIDISNASMPAVLAAA